MRRILFFLMMLATFVSAQRADSTDILFILNPQNDTTRIGAYVTGQLVCAKPHTIDNWSEKERNRTDNLIARVPISIDSAMFYLQQDSLLGGRPKYRLRPHTIRLLKQLPHKRGITRVTAEQLAQGLDSVNVYASVRFDEQNIFSLSILRSQLQKWWRMIQPSVTVYDTVYIDTGGTLEYSTAASAEANENRDVGTDTVIVFKCIASDGTPENSALTIAGWGADDILEFLGDNDTGLWDETKYRFYGNIGITISSSHVKLENIYMRAPGISHVYQLYITSSGNGLISIKNSFFSGEQSGSVRYIRIADNTTVQFYNCIFANIYGNGDNGIFVSNTSAILQVKNCTFYNCDRAIWAPYIPATTLNTITQLCANSYSSSGLGDYNIDDSGDAQMPGVNSITATVAFVDAVGSNFALAVGSAGIDAGTPDTTGLYLPMTDIAGNARISNDRIDIGAFECQVSAPAENSMNYNNRSEYRSLLKY